MNSGATFPDAPTPRVWICGVHGVLVDSAPIIRAAFAATAERFRFRLRPPDFDRVKGLTLLDAYGVLYSDGEAETTRQFHLAFVRERLDDARACTGVIDVLTAARIQGIRIGATTCHGEIAEACLVRTGLYPLIDGLVTQEEVRQRKPHPESIRRVLTLLAIGGELPRGERALYVGDTVLDIQMGTEAGVQTVGASYGLSTEAELRAAHPDSVIQSFWDMQMFLTRQPIRASPSGARQPRPRC